MLHFLRGWPTMALALVLLLGYAAMAQWAHPDDGPRTFVAAVAATMFGYALAKGPGSGGDDSER